MTNPTESTDKLSIRAAYAEMRAFAEITQIYLNTLRWTTAGSFRRHATAWKDEALDYDPTVKVIRDLDHVIVPKMVVEETGALPFPGVDSEKPKVNALWVMLDNLVNAGEIEKGNRWGPKNRQVILRGFKHDIFACDMNTFGKTLLIRTGPEGFSRKFVTRLNDLKFKHDSGKILTEDNIEIPVTTETKAFDLAGWSFIEPHKR